MARPAPLPALDDFDDLVDDDLLADPEVLAAMAPGLIADVNWLLDLAEGLTGTDRAFFEPPQPGDTFH
jgi:hypothetical protein